MSVYISVVNSVTLALYMVMLLLTIHFMFFGIVGVFKKKTFPHTEQKLRYGVIIPARNEEAVVSKLIESIQQCDYPQDKLHIFVIAHNCTDRTAEVARRTGATVYEYNNPEECTMGYAFRHLFDCIRRDYGVENYDGFFLFNADNILDKHYFEKMNDAFVACDRQSIITSFRNSKNFGSNLMSAMYGLYFAYGCRFESRGRTYMNVSTRVQGTGYVINSELVKNGWDYVTLTEDWEFTVDQILQGKPIVFCDDAVFYDEQPTTVDVMWRQRLRWSRGHLLVCIARFREIVRELFRKKDANSRVNKFSLYDIGVNIMPVCVITICITLLRFVLYLFAPLFGDDFFSSMGELLAITLWPAAFFYVITVLSSLLLFFLERERITNISWGLRIASAFLWPIFLFVSFPCEAVALFAKNLGWKPIPHTDTTDFEALNKKLPKQSDVRDINDINECSGQKLKRYEAQNIND